MGVHINSIKGKDQRTKSLGVNPLASVGVTFSSDGRTGTLWELVGGAWTRYQEIRGLADYSTNVAEQYRGKGFNLSNWYPTYDWVAHNGYANFPTWVG